MSSEPTPASEIESQPHPPEKPPPPTKPMTQTERSALLKVVKGRIKVYRSQMKVRETEIRDMIQTRIVEETEEARKVAEEEAAEFSKRYAELMDDAKRFVIQKIELGVAPGSFEQRTDYVRSKSGPGRYDFEYEEVVKTEVRPGELLPNLHGWTEEWHRAIASRNRWVPANVKQRVDDEYAKLAREKGYADNGLVEREQGIEEEILLTALESGTARQYLDGLPSVESLMPLPTAEELKQIEA
jgi:hypothetical protein